MANPSVTYSAVAGLPKSCRGMEALANHTTAVCKHGFSTHSLNLSAAGPQVSVQICERRIALVKLPWRTSCAKDAAARPDNRICCCASCECKRKLKKKVACKLNNLNQGVPCKLDPAASDAHKMVQTDCFQSSGIPCTHTHTVLCHKLCLDVKQDQWLIGFAASAKLV